MLSRLAVRGSQQYRAAFALLCSVGACNVYSADLMSGALSTGGVGNSGGAGVAAGGASAGMANTAGTSSAAGSSAGGMATGGTGATSQAGAGGSTNAGTTGMAGSSAAGTSAAGGSAAGASSLDLIDNLEDGDGSIRLVATPRRDGIWDSGNDATVGGVQTPVPGMFKPVALLAADAPYAGDKYAAYSKATGFTSYAFMNVSMRSWPTYDTTYPKYDASGYKGLTFLAKAGSGSSLGMRVRFISGDTDPRGGKCKLATAQDPSPPEDELCYNHYYAPVTLSNSWATYTLSFTDDFLQPVVTNPTIDLTEMYGLEFYFGSGDNYEIWVDDLSFVRN
ncbi:MAG TPA: hypothetical protein VK745_31970 [Polyangiaceae bacterium]|nr:hypothetical protein [Polyangiaceae bacterium]